MAYNEVTGKVMMFGGTVQFPGDRRTTNETWFSSPGTGWFRCGDPAHPGHPCGDPMPRARNGVGLAYGDAGVARMVLFGGGVGQGPEDKFNDTWTWTSTEGWVCRSEPNCNEAPPPEEP